MLVVRLMFVLVSVQCNIPDTYVYCTVLAEIRNLTARVCTYVKGTVSVIIHYFTGRETKIKFICIATYVSCCDEILFMWFPYDVANCVFIT